MLDIQELGVGQEWGIGEWGKDLSRKIQAVKVREPILSAVEPLPHSHQAFQHLFWKVQTLILRSCPSKLYRV